MLSLIARLRRREALVERPVEDERDLVAFVNEARSEAQRQRIVAGARRRAAVRR